MPQQSTSDYADLVRKAKLPITIRKLYEQSSNSVSYRTFYRRILELRAYISIKKVSGGRGKGINWIIYDKIQKKEQP